MKLYASIAAMLLLGSIAFADNQKIASQSPTLMTIAGHPVSLAEFNYFYSKNNSVKGNEQTDVDEYLRHFIDYRLKLQAALDAHVNVPNSFMEDIESSNDEKAYHIYKVRQQNVAGMGGAIKAAQILIKIDQMATNAEQSRAKDKADAIYQALRNGADFSVMARSNSDDLATAQSGGELPWIVRGQTVKAFEDVAFSMQVGTISEPVLSEYGYHIIKLDDKQNFIPYDALRSDIHRMLDARDIRDRIEDERFDGPVSVSQSKRDVEEWQGLESEYRDGLLVYEICNKEVWERASSDKQGLISFFEQNKRKKKYKGKRPDHLVMADYQDQLEKQWVASLRRKYPVKVDPDVLATVNKH